MPPHRHRSSNKRGGREPPRRPQHSANNVSTTGLRNRGYIRSCNCNYRKRVDSQLRPSCPAGLQNSPDASLGSSSAHPVSGLDGFDGFDGHLAVGGSDEPKVGQYVGWKKIRVLYDELCDYTTCHTYYTTYYTIMSHIKRRSIRSVLYYVFVLANLGRASHAVTPARQVDARELEELLDCFRDINPEELLTYARTFVHATLYITAVRAVFKEPQLLTQVQPQ
eukprot:5703710-Pyramimonas_sp.AAC.1